MNTPRFARPAVPVVCDQHGDDLDVLRERRLNAVAAPNETLATLARLDELLAAHVDALEIAKRVSLDSPFPQRVQEAAAGQLIGAGVAGSVDATRLAELLERVNAVLAGDRGESLVALEDFASGRGPMRLLAFSIVLRLGDDDASRSRLAGISEEADAGRTLLKAVGTVGDPFYIPWLIKQMSDPLLTRLAGESFSMITGLDLAALDLERKPPEDFESGPNDDPDDENVEMDPDDGLPWPDPEKIAAWWKENESRFPAGQRFFMGAPPSMSHCLQVLKSGYQRQRIAAAIWRCILEPGTPLFPTDAPAWRQRRWLAQMEA